jgi:hypothetical protein
LFSCAATRAILRVTALMVVSIFLGYRDFCLSNFWVRGNNQRANDHKGLSKDVCQWWLYYVVCILWLIETLSWQSFTDGDAFHCKIRHQLIVLSSGNFDKNDGTHQEDSNIREAQELEVN